MAEVPLPSPTQAPVPSTDIRNQVYAGAMLDKFITSSGDLTYTDRLGNEHPTIDGIKKEVDDITEVVTDARDEAVQANQEVQETAAQLPTKQQFTELQVSVDSITADPTNAITSITIPALDFSLAIGSASFGMIASRLSGWQFTHGADASVTKMIDLPSHWTKMRISLIWANLVANTGDVSFSGLIQSWSAGESFNQAPAGGGIVAAANATPYIGIETQIALDLPVDPTRHTTIRVGRNGSSASDTLPTAMVLFAVRLIKVA
ncbi:hypothetical protein FCG73_009445 [Klebsiella pneumoniae]|uniref:hypothetical protein n=1 Tax=Klebsiella pneumoniae TaxID=573 RepID=UPI0011446324|nr:hypothetical protein [Klebsiella pneumoniae]EKX2980513.1 hypothetical protein [Klebsiella pneumoniae]TYX29621.1 hypothetical protein FCG78_005305 [Klebsiella pneumoniae]TYX43766.1 hypothetical protein FCG70_004570 [Klebsiella pneumoniae]TYX53978.1 hypothetical protein FCG73_009445 [Klebsiella pneumoniae]TYY61738.1 hypothetical protein FCG98_006135 [Klebsiella pneumoniae]